MAKNLTNEKDSKVAALKAKQTKKEQTFKEKTSETVRSFAWALGVFYFVQTFFLQAFTIPTSSMVSTLLVGDFIFVNKFVYGAQTPDNIPFTDVKLPRYRFPSFKEPKQGDVVVFRFPHPELTNMQNQLGLDYINVAWRRPAKPWKLKTKNCLSTGKNSPKALISPASITMQISAPEATYFQRPWAPEIISARCVFQLKVIR